MGHVLHGTIYREVDHKHYPLSYNHADFGIFGIHAVELHEATRGCNLSQRKQNTLHRVNQQFYDIFLINFFDIDTTVLLGVSSTAMKADARGVTNPPLPFLMQNACASMQKRMLYWRGEGSVLEAMPYCIVIRESHHMVKNLSARYADDGPCRGSCPCLKCTIKIVQTGVKEVVYNLSYKMSVFVPLRRLCLRLKLFC